MRESICLGYHVLLYDLRPPLQMWRDRGVLAISRNGRADLVRRIKIIVESIQDEKERETSEIQQTDTETDEIGREERLSERRHNEEAEEQKDKVDENKATDEEDKDTVEEGGKEDETENGERQIKTEKGMEQTENDRQEAYQETNVEEEGGLRDGDEYANREDKEANDDTGEMHQYVTTTTSKETKRFSVDVDKEVNDGRHDPGKVTFVKGDICDVKRLR